MKSTHPILKLLVAGGLLCSWGLFFILARASLHTIRNVPGWEKFLFAEQPAVFSEIIDRSSQTKFSAASNYTTRCTHSKNTRLKPEQEGIVITHGLRLRDDNLHRGPLLAQGDQFITIGVPFCGSYPGSSHEMLWWPVRILTGNAKGETGWIAESGCTTNQCTIVYNIIPK